MQIKHETTQCEEGYLNINVEKKDFINLCKEGKLEEVKELIKEGIDINQQDNNGYTALIVSTYCDNVEIVEELLKAGAKTDIKNNKGETSLTYADTKCAKLIETHNEQILKNKHFEEFKKEMNIKNDFINLCKEGKLEEVKELIKEGVDINQQDEDGCTALHMASYNENVETVKLLLKAGAKTDIYDDEGNTALIAARSIGNKKSTKLIETHNEQILKIKHFEEFKKEMNIKDEKDINKELIQSIKDGKLNGVKELIKNCIDINQQDENGWTVLHYAAKFDRIQTVVELLKAGAKTNIKSNKGNTALDISNPGSQILIENHNKKNNFIQFIKQGKLEETKELIKEGFNINQQDNDGDTALHWASSYERFQIVEELLKADAKTDIKNKHGSTALEISKQFDHSEISKLIENHNKKNNFIQLIKDGKLNGVKELIKDCIDINQQDKNGWTVLHWAARFNRNKTVEELLKAGAKTDIKSNKGSTALDISKNHSPSIALLIIKHNKQIKIKDFKIKINNLIDEFFNNI